MSALADAHPGSSELCTEGLDGHASPKGEGCFAGAGPPRPDRGLKALPGCGIKSGTNGHYFYQQQEYIS